MAHQASGLIGLAESNSPRLIAMVNHGDAQSELPVLWQLCAALTELDHVVTVLDATKAETEHNPGLLQMLEYRTSHSLFDADSPECCVVPSALGLRQIRRTAQLQELGHLFSRGSTLILYAPAEIQVRVLQGSGVRPLLCTCRERNSLLSSYRALKQLLLSARLEPTILNMMGTAHVPNQGPGMPDNLIECARQFLGFEAMAIPFDASQAERQRLAQLRRVGMRLVENALQLESNLAMAGAAGNSAAHGIFSRNL